MIRKIVAVAALSFFSAVPAALAAGPATVTVRAEGFTETKVPLTTVNTDTTPVSKNGNPSCSGTSGAGALEKATGGDWGGPFFSGLGYSVEIIKGERWTFSDPRSWTFWLNRKEATTGICDAELNPGDELLFFPQEFDSSTFAGILRPLAITAPARATPGAPFTVTVVSYESSGQSSPQAGATVTFPGGSATTGADGRATLAIPAGEATLTVNAAQRIRDAAKICATTGSDGFCGTAAPGGGASTTSGGSTGTGGGPGGSGGSTGYSAPRPAINGLRAGQSFAKGKGPRELGGSVALGSGRLLAVKLRLLRRDGRACSYYSGKSEEFKRATCGKGFAFRVGNDSQWSYLLPERLEKGRYTLEVAASDTDYVRTAETVAFTVK